MALDWTEHPTRRRTICGRQLRWHARGTSFYVIKSIIRGKPTVVYAFLADRLGGRVLKTHRTVEAAKRTCERNARQLQEA